MAPRICRDSYIPIPYLRECLSYDSETGELTWKRRPLEHFFNRRAWAIWNTKWVGKQAGARARGILHLSLRIPGGEMRHLLGHRVGYALTHGRWPEHEVDHRDGVEAGDDQQPAPCNSRRKPPELEEAQPQRLWIPWRLLVEPDQKLASVDQGREPPQTLDTMSPARKLTSPIAL